MSLIKNSLVYTIVGIVRNSIPLALIFLFTREFNPLEYGTLEIFSTTNNLTGIIISFAFVSYLMKIFFNIQKEDVAKFVWGSFVIQFWVMVLMMGVLYVLMNILPNTFIFPTYYFFLIPILGFLSLPGNTHLYILRNREKVYMFSFIVLGTTILEVSLTLFFIIKKNLGWEGRVFGILFTNSIFAIINFIILFKSGYILFKWDNNIMKKAVKHCLPFIPASIAAFFLNSSDLYVITNYLGAEKTAFYSNGYKFGFITQFLISSIVMAFTPYLYKMFSIEENKEKVYKFILILKVVFFFVAIGSVFVSWVLFEIEFVDPIYKKSFIFVPFISFAYFLSAIQGVYNAVINQFGKAKIIALISIIGGLLNLVLNILFIPRFGSIFACFTTIFSFWIMLVFSFIYSQKAYELPWKKRSSYLISYKELKQLI